MKLSRLRKGQVDFQSTKLIVDDKFACKLLQMFATKLTRCVVDMVSYYYLVCEPSSNNLGACIHY